MKYKLLLMGTNAAAIDDFFRKAEHDFDLLTTTVHYNDIKNHIKYCNPDLIVYCIHQESRTSITNIVSLKQQAIGIHIPFVIIGNQEDCDTFNKIAVNVVDLTLVKPLNASAIRDKLMEFADRIHLQAKTAEAEQGQDALAPSAAGSAPSPAAGSHMSELEDILGSLGIGGAAEAAPKPYVYAPKKQKDIPAGEKLHILVVDDDVRLVKTLKLFLEDEYHVATAVNGAVALRYLEDKPADLILLDYEMPGMSGPEVLEKIRSYPGLLEIPVIFLTGASERGKIAKALSLKPQGYLLKPVERVALMNKLHEILG